MKVVRSRRSLALVVLALTLSACHTGCFFGDDDNEQFCNYPPPPPPPQSSPTTLTATASALFATVDESSGMVLTLDSATLYSDSAHCPVFQASATLNGVAMNVQSPGGAALDPQCNPACCPNYDYACSKLVFVAYDSVPFANADGLDFVVTDSTGSFEIKGTPSPASVTIGGSNVFAPGEEVGIDVSPRLLSVPNAVVVSDDGTQGADVTSGVQAVASGFEFTMPPIFSEDSAIAGAECSPTNCPATVSGSVITQSSDAFSICDFGACTVHAEAPFTIAIVLSAPDGGPLPVDAGVIDASGDDDVSLDGG